MNAKSKWSVRSSIGAVLAVAVFYWAMNYTVVGFVTQKYHFPRNIFEAAESGSTWQIGKFLARGAKVNARDDLGLTPLLWAINKNKPPAAEFLISKGADVNVSGNGDSALCWALMRKNEHMVELLLDHGARADDRDHEGRTPLLMLISSSGWLGEDERLAELLVEHGADVNARDKYNSSPRGYAERYHWDNTIRLLRAHGAKR